MYSLRRLWLSRDKEGFEKWKELMVSSGLDTSESLDFSLGLFDKDRLIATGSSKDNIIKCLAVSEDYQSENLLAKIVQELISHLHGENKFHYFLYTKPNNLAVFKSLGFQEIISTDVVSFMEKGIPSFMDYTKKLLDSKVLAKKVGSIVMNANPFTKGHQYLVEQASKECDHVYVFVLTENLSEFSTNDRFEMVKLGTSHLNNVTVLPTDEYIISSATFPTYFLKKDFDSSAVKAQATLDAILFKEKIAPVLNITYRFVGEEPFSPTTDLYNQSLKSIFKNEITLKVIPRIAVNGDIISATKVRQAMKDGNNELLSTFLPTSTYNYLKEMKR